MTACIGFLQADACLAGWRDSLKWAIGLCPGMGPDLGAAMGRSSKPDELKNPRRVMAGKMAYERKKAAQDAADKEFLEKACMYILGIGAAIFLIFLIIAKAIYG
jgi:hypothetical protein